jgi:hypothetical protein
MTANGSLNGRPSDKRRKGAKLPLNGCLKLTREGLATAETSHSTACTSVMYTSAAGFTTCPVHLSSAHVVFKAHDRRMCRTCHASPDSPYPTEPCSRWEPRRRPNPSKCHLRRMTAGPGNVKAQCHFPRLRTSKRGGSSWIKSTGLEGTCLSTLRGKYRGIPKYKI